MKKPTRKQVLAAAGALAVLLIVLGVWLFRPDPQMAKVKALQQELAAAAGGGADRRQKWQELGEELRKLTPGQRLALRGAFRQRRQAELSRYFTLSKAEKTRWLDERIDRMEAMRRSGQANGRGGNGPNPGAGWRNLSPDDREQRRRAMLDQTTPEERAQRDQFLHDLNARRLQRGLGGFGGWR
jgi:hypothetical protein